MAKPREPQEPELDEVERALSILEGRHPDHQRTARQTRAAAVERQAALAKERATSLRRQRRRALVIGLNVAALAGASVVAWRLVARAQTMREELDRVSAAFVAAGWSEIASNVVTARPRLDVEVPGSSCVVALSSSGEPIAIKEEGRTLEAPGSVGFCTCESGVKTIVEARGSSTLNAVGISLVRIDARAIGGPLARSWATPTPALWGDGGFECAEATIDAWLADGHASASSADDAWLEQEPTRAPLRRAQFHVVARVPPERPFIAVTTPAGQCVLAVAGESDLLSLRLSGGARPISRARGSLIWCAAEAATVTVWREGAAPVVALAAPAEALGGLLGTRESAAAAGVIVDSVATWLSDADLAWDARCVMRASLRAGAATDVVSAPMPAEPGVPAAQLVALSLAPEARVAWEPVSAAPACDPPLGSAGTMRESVCIHAAPAAWWRKGDAPAATARGSLPFWLAPLEPVREPAAVALVPKLLALARQLGADGFTPTLLEGVTELVDGIRVVGRANEDAIVAVGLGPTAPWVHPFTRERPWNLGDSPGVVQLGPGESVKLTALPLPGAPLDRRRTVVFRREVRRDGLVGAVRP